MYLQVTFMANHNGFTLFGYHNTLPMFFSFKVFHLVYMMDFALFAVITSTHFAGFNF